MISVFYRIQKKALGQNFLINKHIAEIEAAHAMEKNVLELGPGIGVLTKELCKVANRVVAVEIDPLLYNNLKHSIDADNLKLINKDFFKATSDELELNSIDIMIANIPYKLSSKVVEFLSSNNLQAVLCLQKEFVEHMLAKPGTRKYSRLSVTSQLSFNMTKITGVPKGNFRPVPKVDSIIIYMKPKSKLSEKDARLITLIMQHKKKTLRNAIEEAAKNMGIGKEKAKEMAESIAGTMQNERAFKLNPEELLEIARQISRETNQKE
ncbi:MAG: 16S rRNA (adenine(1518)-N(6)/adenine(1519)-N(6))-dimethyltransferase RsmA [Candidatus Micrarchaeaceae archaeon]